MTSHIESDKKQKKQMSLGECQSLIETMYGHKDGSRGVDGTFMWFLEEVGELAGALREGSDEDLAAEFADTLAWLVTLANIRGVDLNQAMLDKYGNGCPGCQSMECVCGSETKP